MKLMAYCVMPAICWKMIPRCASSPARDPEGLEIIRHSTAHLLAQAVERLLSGIPVHDRPGDRRRLLLRFLLSTRIHAWMTSIALAAEMRRIIKDCHCRWKREVWQRGEAIQFFQQESEEYKAKIIEDLPDAVRTSHSTARVNLSICAGDRTFPIQRHWASSA